MEHTKGPWKYESGAVWANEGDADRPECIAIALRGVQPNGNIQEQFTPTEKDANLRLAAASPTMLEALGAAKLVLINRANANDDTWKDLAAAALEEVTEAIEAARSDGIDPDYENAEAQREAN